MRKGSGVRRDRGYGGGDTAPRRGNGTCRYRRRRRRYWWHSLGKGKTKLKKWHLTYFYVAPLLRAPSHPLVAPLPVVAPAKMCGAPQPGGAPLIPCPSLRDFLNTPLVWGVGKAELGGNTYRPNVKSYLGWGAAGGGRRRPPPAPASLCHLMSDVHYHTRREVDPENLQGGGAAANYRKLPHL